MEKEETMREARALHAEYRWTGKIAHAAGKRKGRGASFFGMGLPKAYAEAKRLSGRNAE